MSFKLTTEHDQQDSDQETLGAVVLVSGCFCGPLEQLTVVTKMLRDSCGSAQLGPRWHVIGIPMELTGA